MVTEKPPLHGVLTLKGCRSTAPGCVRGGAEHADYLGLSSINSDVEIIGELAKSQSAPGSENLADLVASVR
jgi:hypothetical protein